MVIQPMTFSHYERNAHDYPISPRENLMRVLNGEKPMWMPDLYEDAQMCSAKSSRDMAPTKSAAGVDWFGTNYVFSKEIGINMPNGGVFDCVTEWREKVKWPDLDAIDWSHDADDFVRDENKALYMRMSNGIFERLHAFEGFEQCLLDMITETEECRALFERLADYKIALFNHIRDVFPLDFIIAADDYGTARAPFFSNQMFEETLLEPTRRFVEAVHARGTKFIAHCCGVVDPFMPYFANELGVDGLEIQELNDLPAIARNYGDRMILEIKADNNVVFDPDVTDEAIIAEARRLVDTFGAHAVPGSGAAVALRAGSEHAYKLLEDEVYRYSLEKYRAL